MNSNTPPGLSLAELLAFARLGYEVRRQQREYFAAAKKRDYATADTLLVLARQSEATFDRAVVSALKSQIAELRVLARSGRTMREKQLAYFAARKKKPTDFAHDELRAARTAEADFDRDVAAALKKEQPVLPGMETGEAEGGDSS